MKDINKMIKTLKKEMQKELIGQEKLIDTLLIGLLTQGHILIEGVPGLAKTRAVNALAKVLAVDFKRVQFTPDLLPQDILGGQIYDMHACAFKMNKGPIFTNLLLADEINRAPAKVQSALLEVMQERQVTIGVETYKMQTPFLVLATQNPLDDEGAYLLSMAQLDRFMFKTLVSYPTEAQEYEIATKVANDTFEPIRALVDSVMLQRMTREAKEMHIDDNLSAYIVRLVSATREPAKYGAKSLEDVIMYGASPRATIDLIKASKASAYIRGNDFVSPVDIGLCVRDVLRHRLVLSYEAQSEDVSVDSVLDTLLAAVKIT